MSGLALSDFVTLPLAVLCIAGGLLLLNVLTKGRDWPERFYYAEGLITVLVGLALWLAATGRIDWGLALILVVAGCASGGPDFLLLWHQRNERARSQLAQLARENHELAARLALLQQMDARQYQRIVRLAETLSFSLGAARQEMEMLELFQQQVEPVFRPVLDALSGNGARREN